MKKVKCVSPGGYANIREGEIVDLVRIELAYQDPSSASGFTWPEYWVVQRPDGTEAVGHSHRFELLDAPASPETNEMKAVGSCGEREGAAENAQEQRP